MFWQELQGIIYTPLISDWHKCSTVLSGFERKPAQCDSDPPPVSVLSPVYFNVSRSWLENSVQITTLQVVVLSILTAVAAGLTGPVVEVHVDIATGRHLAFQPCVTVVDIHKLCSIWIDHQLPGLGVVIEQRHGRVEPCTQHCTLLLETLTIAYFNNVIAIYSFCTLEINILVVDTFWTTLVLSSERNQFI